MLARAGSAALARGDRLQVDDRISWSEYVFDGDCYYRDVLDMPQKQTAQRRTQEPMNPGLSHLCDIVVDVGPIRDLGPTPHGRRRVIAIHGGRVHGPRLTAAVLPGGADWQYLRSDGVVELEARYAMRTPAGIEIAVTNRGLRRAPPEIMERLARGEPVDPALVYFRTVPVFEAPDGPLDWLNRSVFIASAERQPSVVQIRVFEVL